ncbi:hypothetical protein DL98DRAFT_519563 [Cadophora sp. DSE1049]|nr:hypothetical protein DL98DRAFT_519563 [Cadophora sp. DSE1049]
MLQHRTPLGAISTNHIPGKHLSPYLQGKVASAAFASVKPGGIAKALNLHRDTINYTLLQDNKRNKGKTIPKAARRRSYTLAKERKLLQHVRKFPKDSYEDVIRACNLSCKVSTIKKILANQTTYIVLSSSRVDP